MALVGRVIASHFAEPLARTLKVAAPFLLTPAPDADVVSNLPAGAEIQMLDNSRGWAWGYADGLVGYVRSDAVA